MPLQTYSAQTDLPHTPLAARMRPKSFEEFVGQEHIVGRGKPLRELIKKDQLSSLILWGPPGTGKTSLAYVIASETKSHFVYLSAVTATLEDLRKIIKEAKKRLNPPTSSSSLFIQPPNNQVAPRLSQKKKIQRTILTVDEIHRWNRAQQAVLLPYVEDGTIILVGCTTENPYFEVISPLLSRAIVYQFRPLSEKDLEKILKRAITILPKKVKFSQDSINAIIGYSNGDARRALNILETAFVFVMSKNRFSQTKESKMKISKETIKEIVLHQGLLYDKNRDAHYDTISAFIKSMRGSDPDAAVFYLVKMLEAGEDPKFIARRIMILASEDIGNADPNAINVAASAFEAVEKVGLPEAELALAQAAIYMATAPKSNAVYKALLLAKKDLATKGAGEIPLHLRNAPHPGLEKHGYGLEYKYPHNFKNGYVPGEKYLPEHLERLKKPGELRYYHPSNRGYEKIINARLKAFKKQIADNRTSKQTSKDNDY